MLPLLFPHIAAPPILSVLPTDAAKAEFLIVKDVPVLTEPIVERLFVTPEILTDRVMLSTFMFAFTSPAIPDPKVFA